MCAVLLLCVLHVSCANSGCSALLPDVCPDIMCPDGTGKPHHFNACFDTGQRSEAINEIIRSKAEAHRYVQEDLTGGGDNFVGAASVQFDLDPVIAPIERYNVIVW